MKHVVITSIDNRIRAGILEDGKLIEVLDDTERESRLAGNIYKGKVMNIVPGIQAAFVDIGTGRNAFLYVGDAVKASDGKNSPLPPIEHLLREGQELIVQVMRESIARKGARVTTNLSLPGRFVVLLPNHEAYIAVSRKITAEDERNRLQELARRLLPEDSGLIVRTLAEGVSDKELIEDMEKLIAVNHELAHKITNKNVKGLLYSDNDPFSRLIREMIDHEVEKITVDSGEVAEILRRSLFEVGCKAADNVWTDFNENLFEKYSIDNGILQALEPKVTLESGGYLIIEQTEALSVIDVNSGKYTGGHCLHDTLLKLNLEAAVEVSRQIRLRNLSGIIIVDFIDMEKPEDWETLLKQLEYALMQDKTKCQVIGLTKLGLVEITRKKEGQTLAARYSVQCEKCRGKGFISAIK